MERGSPKSCFLFVGEVLCDVNWLSVLSDHFQTSPASTLYPSCPDTLKESHAMLVYLLYMLVFLAKEEQIVSQQVRFYARLQNAVSYLLSISFMFALNVSLPSTIPPRTPLSSVCWSRPPLCPGTNWTYPHTKASWGTSAPTTPPRCCSLLILRLSCCSSRCAVPPGSTPAPQSFLTG